ncbi:unnamed protein product [Paramecium primaurelia]|uniref:Uncharacterized protein n=2 Tax=Paramecium TaxID=5884 RepID=A0A8S1U8R0_9CILI|nr:unnamed protein product [Paramecium primaurelia]CAD8161525.1 unnamed protein product [Paramecium pentaurelia]
MLKKCTDNPKIAETLKQLVQERGQKRWPEIAKVLESMYDIKIEIPFTLKAIYQDIMNPRPGLNTEQLKLLVTTAMKYRSVIRLALPEFQKVSGIGISRHKFVSRLYRFYKNTILAGIQIFIRNKMDYRKRLAKFPGQSIGRILQCKELTGEDDFTQRLKLMAEQLEILLNCYLQLEDERDYSLLYDILTPKMNKKTFFLLLNCISFMDDLRCIQQNVIKSDDELMPDYWLQPTIKENKELLVYKKLFLDDMDYKFRMYTDSQDVQTEIDFKFFLNNAYMKPKSVVTQRSAKLKTVRGKITVNDKKYPSDKTIIFDQPEEESEQEGYEIDFKKHRLLNKD